MANGYSIYKVLATIVLARLKKYVEAADIIPDTQNGFREGRSTVDNIYVLNQGIKKTLEAKKKLCALFVDFLTAFDSVDRPRLFTIMKKQNIPDDIIAVIQRMYRATAYRIGEQKFYSHKGLKQGCPLSPLLFALYMANLDKVLQGNQLGGLIMEGHKIYCISFADDIVLLAESAEELKDMGKALQRFANRQKR